MTEIDANEVRGTKPEDTKSSKNGFGGFKKGFLM